MTKEKSINYLLTVLLIISVSVNLFAWREIENLESSVEKLKEQNQSRGLELIENDITYTTFSSPKADFEFEYPVFILKDGKKIEGKIKMEVLVNHEF